MHDMFGIDKTDSTCETWTAPKTIIVYLLNGNQY